MALAGLQRQSWSHGGVQEGPPRPRCWGGAAPPGDIRVPAHCGEVCDARSGAEPHIWARSRLLEAVAPQLGDPPADKSSPGAATCTGSGAAATSSPACAGGSGQLRLVGGGGRCAGRVEVNHDGEWGSACVFDFDWEARWATVVCRQLGCGRVAWSSPFAPFGQGSGRIWLQPYFCRGTEEVLEECPHFGWGQHRCGHERDVGVICTESMELRLVGGGPCAGRVEVKLRGHWGSVGDPDWFMEDAEVVCQQLGCGSAAGAYSARNRFGTVAGPLNLAVVNCKGDEATLWDCKIRGWGPYNGTHEFDTAVICQGFSRLVGGDRACAGRLEVRQRQAWVGVCAEHVDMKVAQVVCRELGCGAALAIPGSGRFGAGTGPLWEGGFNCSGTEPLLSACGRRVPHGQGCAGHATIICSPYTGFRLGNSSSGCAGRVEVAVRGTWGSVCATDWDLPDADVLCRHLGCGHAVTVPPGGSFGSGDGPLRPDAFGCSGSERHPGECPVAVLGEPPCSPGNAAAVNCSGIVNSVRLVEGESRCDGWLELAISPGVWRRVPGEVLAERNFSVVCGRLGCGGLDRSDAVVGTVPVWNMSDSEQKITIEVVHTLWKMTNQEMPVWLNDLIVWNMTTGPTDIPHGAAIVCSGSRRVRLAGGAGRCAGRVEVYAGGTWSSVCQERWDLQAAAVVCRELGCGAALEAPGSARLGPGPGRAWPYVVECAGSEESLWECPRSERRECERGAGAGAVCSGAGRAVGAIPDAIYQELDYSAMPEYQEVPSRPGSPREGSVKKLLYYTGDSVEGSDSGAVPVPAPPALPGHGTPDGYDDATAGTLDGYDDATAGTSDGYDDATAGTLDGYDDATAVPEESPTPSTGDISEGVARRGWICVPPTVVPSLGLSSGQCPAAGGVWRVVLPAGRELPWEAALYPRLCRARELGQQDVECHRVPEVTLSPAGRARGRWKGSPAIYRNKGLV
ncbi:deleted in malignant brain tumors 1 protein-like [Chiroxiphia lanceolata]|uniref:deleted in malignant brain tumors 1 protein-like n=1 Tax=Chiroxiphia lanceolata TaxID=296741 RepID=UPI0013CEA76A|nr:deleted in malignant brain tumors 1 protein-like [Chiroxiphia lanceolata]